MKKTIFPLVVAIAFASLGAANAHNRIFGLGGSVSDPAEHDADGDGVLSDEELAAAKAARKAAAEQAKLDAYDADGDGLISDEEKAAAKEARSVARAAKRQAVIDEFDADLDGVLNEEERAAAKAARSAERQAAKEARFAEIDGDSSGGLSAEEVQVALFLNEDRLASTMARYDGDADGSIALEEFLNPVRSSGHHGRKGHRRHHGKGGCKDGEETPTDPVDPGTAVDPEDSGADSTPEVAEQRRSSSRSRGRGGRR